MNRQYKHKNTGKIATLLPDNNYYRIENEHHPVAAWIIESGEDWVVPEYEIITKCPIEGTIHSVKRLKDQKLFTIGDYIRGHEKPIWKIEWRESAQDIWLFTGEETEGTALNYATKVQPVVKEPVKDIVNITIGDKMYTAASYVGESFINTLEQARVGKIGLGTMNIKVVKPVQDKVILVTEDSVSITDPQAIVYQVDDDWMEYCFHAEYAVAARSFSIEAARTQYILTYKPLLSIADIEKVMCAPENFDWDNIKPIMIKEAEKKLAQNK